MNWPLVDVVGQRHASGYDEPAHARAEGNRPTLDVEATIDPDHALARASRYGSAGAE
jgi:hypothetical protein